MPRNNNDEDEAEEEVEEKPEPTCCEKCSTRMRNFGHFMWNSETKECMGRSPLSWAAVLTYYLFFYAFLAAFWAACLAGFMSTLDPYEPTQIGNFSMLKANPGMTYEPSSTSDTLIQFSTKNVSEGGDYIQRLNDTLKPYLDAYNSLTQYDNASLPMTFCDPAAKSSSRGYTCVYDMDQIPVACREENLYGFRLGTPCLFLRPNKIYAFMPHAFYNITAETVKEDPLPPESLLQNYDPNHIAVTCEGENDGDKDSILNVTFYPQHGFPFYFYPYYNQENYLPPFVMAQFRVIPGQVIMVWCRLWAENIKHDKNDRQGGIRFELFVDL